MITSAPAEKRRLLPWYSPHALWQRRIGLLALLSITAIALHLLLRFGLHAEAQVDQIRLLLTLIFGGPPHLVGLLRRLIEGEFGADVLGGLSIVTSIPIGEYLAGAIIVLMLAGGPALERFALRSASSVLSALARRMPSIAHRKRDGEDVDVALEEHEVGDTLVLHPHEICPADGVVLEGHGAMDESYLTGEPFQIAKTAGSTVIPGAINGESVLNFRTTRRAADPRYARIMGVMRESEATRPNLRRLGDRLGASYTPVLGLVAGLERYSKHPQARAILAAAKDDGIALPAATEVSEPPGQGLRGRVSCRDIQVTSRGRLMTQNILGMELIPTIAGGSKPWW